jgi:hypothetical protein
MSSPNLKEKDTDHHIKAMPRTAAPLISPIPKQHPSFLPISNLPEDAELVAGQQYTSKDWMPKTYFAAGFGLWHCILSAPTENFLLFLNRICYVNEYHESPLTPWLARYPLIGKLLSQGYIRLYRVGPEHAAKGFCLVPTAMIGVLSCMDLHRERRWCADLCCSECHSDFRNLSQISDTDDEKYFTSDNGPEGRIARVCCRAILLLPQWHLHKQYHELPSCEL